MYLIKIGEIYLKGKNKHSFEKRLLNNLKRLESLEREDIVNLGNQYLIKKDNLTKLNRLFGISYYAEVLECNFDEINRTALLLVENEETFKVEASRSTKEYKSSNEIERELGTFIIDQRGLRVNLNNPELIVYVEIINGKAYLYNKKIKALKGLPVGSEGHVILLVEDEKLSTVAGFLMMKRGCRVSLTKDLPLLHNFYHKIKIREPKEKDILVSAETVPNEKHSQFTLSPLQGLTEKEIDELYLFIKN